MNLLYQVTEGVTAIDETENSVTLEVGCDFFLGHGTSGQLSRIAMAYMEKDNLPDLWYQVQAWPLRIVFRWDQPNGNAFWVLPQLITIDG